MNGYTFPDLMDELTHNADEQHQAVLTFTKIKATNPACATKEFWMQDGKLQKRTTASVYKGHMSRLQVADAHGFAQALQNLTTDCCLMYGIPPSDAPLVTTKEWIERGRPDDVLPRSIEMTAWPHGPGVMLLDYDAPKDGSPPLPRDDLLALLYRACPAAEQHDLIWWPSTSSHIYEGDRELHGLRGQRIYLMVSDARDIPRAGKALNERLWSLGLGRFEVSASGSLLERPVFDGSVWQTNRIDFAAGAKCGPGLEQRRGLPEIVPGYDGGLLDTARAIPDLTPAEVSAAKAAKDAARAALGAEAEEVRHIWVQEKADELVSANPRMERSAAVKQVARAAESRELMGDWLLTIKGDSLEPLQVPVAEVLDHPERYHGRHTLDPLEPQYDGGRWVGKMFLYGARPTLYSFAHGGVTFRLSRQPQRIEVVRGKGSETTDALLGVLRRAPDIFDFGQELVIVGRGGALHALDEHGLRYEAGRLTQFWGWKKLPHGGMVEELQDPPASICKNVLSLGTRRDLNPLDAVITAPTLRPDGSVLAAPGYDEATRLLFDTEELPAPVPTHPSPSEAAAALDFLWHPFQDFPFVGPLDRAVHLAAVITAAVRPILSTAPAFGYDAPVQGSGKTLLARCIGILTEGKEPSVWPHVASNDEEVRKRLFTVLKSGARCMVWDNVIGQFDSAALASCLTSPTFSDRILGKSASSTVPNRSVFALTGNNLTLAGDLPRRVLVSRIDPQTDKPFARSFDLDPVTYCKAHRQRLVASALTLVRAMLTHGCRAPGAGRLASFEEWDAWVRQTVIYANELRPGEFGDVMDVVTIAQAADPEQEALLHLLDTWVKVFGAGRVVTTAEVLERATGSFGVGGIYGAGDGALQACLEEFTNGKLSARTIGKLLKYRVGRICGGLRLEERGIERGVRRWRVVKVAEKGTAATAGPAFEDAETAF